jgi:ABC-type uncharacterized transport system ATPase subunit
MTIELHHIHKRFGAVHANQDITVTFHPSRIYGILGENGAGKSTLMKILAGYHPPDSGKILLDGVPLPADPQGALACGIGMLQQDPLDVGAFTVLENFMYGMQGGLFYQRNAVKEARKLLLSLANRLRFSLDPDSPVEQLSIPQRQQLEIVRLLALGVRVLILDEPTTGIAADQKETLFNALRELARDDRMTILLVSHKLEDIIALCDEVIVLRGGRLVGQRHMPATTRELVSMMFGDELPVQERPTAALGNTILYVEDMVAVGRRLVVGPVTLHARTGEVIGLAGLEGSGQDLFMRAVAGLYPLRSGKIRLGDLYITHEPYRRRRARGIVFTAAGRLEEGLVSGLTLVEHMALAQRGGLITDWGRVHQRTQEQITRFRVRGNPNDRIEQLSGGNQQRVLLGLLPDFIRVLLLEQPTRGLDVESSQLIWSELLARRDQGTTIIFSSLELDELITYSDRILVFYSGAVFEVPDVKNTTLDQLGHFIGGEFAR